VQLLLVAGRTQRDVCSSKMLLPFLAQNLARHGKNKIKDVLLGLRMIPGGLVWLLVFERDTLSRNLFCRR
jgi:hypothetical protein